VHLVDPNNTATGLSQALAEQGYRLHTLSGTDLTGTSDLPGLATRCVETALRRLGVDPRPLLLVVAGDLGQVALASTLATHLRGVAVTVPPDWTVDDDPLTPWIAAQAGRFSEIVPVDAGTSLPARVIEWSSGALSGGGLELPDKAELPAGDEAAVAAALAQATVQTDGDPLPSMLTALTHAGFTIRRPDNTMPPDGGVDQGIVFEAAELLALASGVDGQLSFPFRELGQELLRMIPLVPGADPTALADGIQSGLAAAAADETSPQHFFALYLAELGRQLPHDSFDLLTADPGTFALTLPQFALLNRRLSLEVLERVRQQAPGTPLFPAAPAVATPAAMDEAVSRYCLVPMTEGESLIADGAAILFGGTMDQMYELIKDMVEDSENTEHPDPRWPGKIGGIVAWANGLLALGRMLLLAALIDVVFDYGSGPLVRTKDRQPGELRTLTTTVTVRLGNLQLLDCLRIWLMPLGLDVRAPIDHAVGGASVDTILAPGQLTPIPVEGQPGETFTDKITDERTGQVTTRVQGRAQPQPLPDEQVAGQLVSVPVEIRVTPNPGSLIKDLLDSVGVLTAAVSSPPLAGLLAASDFVNRNNFVRRPVRILPVIDWIPADVVVVYVATINARRTCSGHCIAWIEHSDWDETLNAHVTGVVALSDVPGVTALTGSGILRHEGVEYSWSNTFTGDFSPSQDCPSLDGLETFRANSGTPGTVSVKELTLVQADDGTPTDLDLLVSFENLWEVGTHEYTVTAPAKCAGSRRDEGYAQPGTWGWLDASHRALNMIDTIGPDMDATHVTGWNFNPDWSRESGGEYASKTIQRTLTLDATNGDVSTITLDETFLVATRPKQ